MYIFKTDINEKEHDEYITSQENCNLLQSSKWAKIKDNWDSNIIGVYDDNKLVFSTLVLIKRLPLKFTMMYIPKGPIMDFSNNDLVSFFFKEIKKWAKKENCLYITFDPSVTYRKFTLDTKDKEDDPFSYKVIETLKENSCIYKGRTMLIHETIQPRFHMGVLSTTDLEHHVPKSTLKAYRAAIKKHVTAKRYGKEGLEDFCHMIEYTENRKGIHLRDYSYFEKLMDVYGEDATIYLAKVNPKIHLNDLKEEIEIAENEMKQPDCSYNIRKRNEQLIKTNKQEIEKLEPLCEKYPTETVIAGGLMVGYGKTMEGLYAGRNEDFRSFQGQYLLYLNKFQYAFDNGYTLYNMGGVEGSLDDGLSQYKGKYNPQITEYIGEFDLPVNTILYKLAKIAQKIKTGK